MRRQFGHDGPLTPHQVGPRPTCLVQLPRMRQARGCFSGIGPSELLPRIAVVSTVIRLPPSTPREDRAIRGCRTGRLELVLTVVPPVTCQMQAPPVRSLRRYQWNLAPQGGSDSEVRIQTNRDQMKNEVRRYDDNQPQRHQPFPQHVRSSKKNISLTRQTPSVPLTKVARVLLSGTPTVRLSPVAATIDPQRTGPCWAVGGAGCAAGDERGCRHKAPGDAR